MFEYSMSAVIFGEAVLMLIILWGVVLFPLLNHYLWHRQERQGNFARETAHFMHAGKPVLPHSKYAKFFSTLSMFAAAALCISFAVH